MEELVLAGWVDRFWAWLIDVLLMGLVWHRLSILLRVEVVQLEGALMLSCLLFLYWTVLEGYRGSPWERCCSISLSWALMERPSATGTQRCSPLARPFFSPPIF